MTNRDDITINAEISPLKAQVTDLFARQARTEGTLEQLNKSIAAGTRMTVWQFKSFVLVMAGTLFGTLYRSTDVLEKRFEQMERHFEQVEINNKERTDELKKRFDDLKQVVLSRR